MERLAELYERLTSSQDDRLPIAVLRAALRWVVLLYKELQSDRAFLRAGGMAYTTLIAIVPLLLLVFGLLGAVGVLEESQKALVQFLEYTLLRGLPEVSDVLVPGLLHADLKALGIAGVLGFLVVVSRLYMMVERAYADIFGVRIQRSLGQRIMYFYMSVTVVPVALVVGTIQAEARLGRSIFGSWFMGVVVFAALLAALKLFPGTRVRWRAALAGSTVSLVLISGAVQLFPLYVRLFATDDPLRVIYGSLGLIPVFLLWLYLLWLFVLLGVEVAFVAQHFRSLADAEFQLAEDELRAVHAPTVAVAVEVAMRVGQAFSRGAAPISLEDLALACHRSVRETRTVLQVLEAAGFVLAVDDGFTIARPPDAISIVEVVEGWRAQTNVQRAARTDPIGDALAQPLYEHLTGSLQDAADQWLHEDEATG